MKISQQKPESPTLGSLVEMVRTSRAQTEFPIQIGKSPHLVVVPELPHVHSSTRTHMERDKGLRRRRERDRERRAQESPDERDARFITKAMTYVSRMQWGQCFAKLENKIKIT